jgi:hypothetical protein
MPSQLAQLKATADNLAQRDADSARLLRALIAELDGKSIEDFARGAGFDLKGRTALYGLGLAPVARVQLADTKAFEAFVGRLEAAYGQKLDSAELDGLHYRRHVFADTGTEAVLAVAGKQAVAALLPADAPEPLLRQALGLDRPAENLQDDGRLEQLAKDKGYQPWAVGQVDLARLLPLVAGGRDPLFAALLKAHAQRESAQTGEPVANQLKIPPGCEADAERIAGRIPGASFGYTRLDARHQDLRWDLALADDVGKAFAGLKVALPGLGADGGAPFDLSLALPVAPLRAFWSAQADAVAAKPFTCPVLADLNDDFAKLGAALQKAAIPPFGDIQGLRIALDSFAADPAGGAPDFTGRVVLATSNPAGLLGMGQLMVSSLAQLKLGSDGKPAALPADLAKLIGQPAWVAMNDKALALGVGPGEDAKLPGTLQAGGGDAGRMLRLRLDGDMYLAWVKLMEQKADAYAASAAPPQDGDDGSQAAEAKALAARSKAQFEAIKAQAAKIATIRGEVHVEDTGLVGTTQTELK